MFVLRRGRVENERAMDVQIKSNQKFFAEERTKIQNIISNTTGKDKDNL